MSRTGSLSVSEGWLQEAGGGGAQTAWATQLVAEARGCGTWRLPKRALFTSFPEPP